MVYINKTKVSRSSMVAYFYIDSKGRRWLLILSLAAMFPFLLATAFSFEPDNPSNKGLIAFFLVCYTMVSLPQNHSPTSKASMPSDSDHTSCEFNSIVLIEFSQAYSPGAGVVPFLYSSEIFPQMLRGTSHPSCRKHFSEA